jgi:hypothetical protein
MKSTIFLLSFILVVSSTNLLAQTDSLSINGIVLSSFDHKPVENITVVLLDGQTKIIYTDTTGLFSFKTAKKDNVQLRIDSKDTIIILNNNSIQNLQFVLFRNCEYNAEKALIDIKKGKAKLLLSGGHAPFYYNGQENFEKKYKIRYYDFGCIGIPRECTKSYNKQVFDYLDNKYGKIWRGEVRSDVVGFK